MWQIGNVPAGEVGMGADDSQLNFDAHQFNGVPTRPDGTAVVLRRRIDTATAARRTMAPNPVDAQAYEIHQKFTKGTESMKHLLFAAAMAAATVPVLAAVGVSISVGEPGFYGRINLGDAPQPVLINPQPIIVQPMGVVGPPLYLHVPPGYEKHWHRHCREYNACGQPVYFVQDRWYNQVYVPHYHEHHGMRDEHHGMRDEHHDRGRDHDDHREDHRGEGYNGGR
jgi:hypothetical protein